MAVSHRIGAAIGAAVLALGMSGCGRPTVAAGSAHPNVVFVLTDDLSGDLLRVMPHVLAMERSGTSFSNYFVTDSLCCPDRASIFSGRYPHSDGVIANVGRTGGYRAFRRSAESTTFATALQSEGYRTGMIGKYLNGYRVGAAEHETHPAIPKGWDEWDVGGSAGYQQFGDDVDENGRVVHYGHAAGDYGTDVMAGQAVSFIRRAATAKRAFVLEVAPYSPHKPATPAPRDAHRFARARAPRYPSFDRPNVAAPTWLRDHHPLAPDQIRAIDTEYRRRLQSVQAIDRLLARVQATLASTGTARETYVVFSSDNGYHMGEHELIAGKQTAFDSDIHVPMVVTGPGVRRGASMRALTENVDLAATFMSIAGARVPASVEGRSLLPLLHGAAAARNWRDAVLVEHMGPDTLPADPDRQGKLAGSPTSYTALRTVRGTYVEYATGEREYYDLRRDPYERVNVFRQLPGRQHERLARELAALRTCTDGASCRAAGQSP